MLPITEVREHRARKYGIILEGVVHAAIGVVAEGEVRIAIGRIKRSRNQDLAVGLDGDSSRPVTAVSIGIIRIHRWARQYGN